MSTIWFVPVACALASALLTGMMRRYALSRQLLDHPNERSSHQIATPRGGGVGIVASFYLGAVALWIWGAFPQYYFWVLLAGIPVAVIGFVDDWGHVSARIRLALHLVAASWVVALAGWPWDFEVGSLITLLFLVFVVTWLVNLYNFMDGIDGIAGIELVTVGASVAFLLWPLSVAVLPLLLAACGVGFLLWNWPPARIFMGDVGSGFIGLALGAILAITVLGDILGLWIWMILLGVFVVDATVTLLRRMLRGDRWYQAHRSHAYQHAAQRFGHAPVTIIIGIVNLFWLFPLAFLAREYSSYGILLCALGYLPLFVVALVFRAGLPVNNQMDS